MLPFTRISLKILCISMLPVCFSCKQQPGPVPNNIIIDSLTADLNPYITRDQSPMDMSYYPVDYPLQKMNKNDSGSLVVRVLYSRPHKKNRVIFGTTPNSLCEYGREWRLGANEATEIEFFRNVSIAGKNISKGRYIIYGIPYPDHWTLVLNSNLDTWGLHMDTSRDVFRTDIPVSLQSPALEDFTMVFASASYGADMIMAWDNVKAVLPIRFSKQ
jgi:hypothetical protein